MQQVLKSGVGGGGAPFLFYVIGIFVHSAADEDEEQDEEQGGYGDDRNMSFDGQARSTT